MEEYLFDPGTVSIQVMSTVEVCVCVYTWEPVHFIDIFSK